MQQALPYRSWLTENSSTNPSTSMNEGLRLGGSADVVVHHPKALEEATEGRNINSDTNKTMVKSMVTENAVIIFGRRGCCMSHVVKRLLLASGVNPAIYEVDREEDEVVLIHELRQLATDDENTSINRGDQFPAVYIGGHLFGGLEQLMGAHISGGLIPILKKAGALWL
ncbi:hypothetical protein C5167_019307 [Papaver somniferum]|uniref:Glutaredoxin domain-containing protein n=1 Tax=Papaver somniferum TaxID=3469 RepID=A0A4Y7IPT4_PAPSO|nr:glutaredoxin-C9-like [Papaver somniferum]RZC50883.1 hypothetical protein C5167_019307 [Papaver somniferum]